MMLKIRGVVNTDTQLGNGDTVIPKGVRVKILSNEVDGRFVIHCLDYVGRRRRKPHGVVTANHVTKELNNDV